MAPPGRAIRRVTDPRALAPVVCSGQHPPSELLPSSAPASASLSHDRARLAVTNSRETRRPTEIVATSSHQMMIFLRLVTKASTIFQSNRLCYEEVCCVNPGTRKPLSTKLFVAMGITKYEWILLLLKQTQHSCETRMYAIYLMTAAVFFYHTGISSLCKNCISPTFLVIMLMRLLNECSETADCCFI